MSVTYLVLLKYYTIKGFEQKQIIFKSVLANRKFSKIDVPEDNEIKMKWNAAKNLKKKQTNWRKKRTIE